MGILKGYLPLSSHFSGQGNPPSQKKMGNRRGISMHQTMENPELGQGNHDVM